MSTAGHNSGEMSDGDKRVLFFIHRNEYVRLLAAKKAADAALKNHGKKTKVDLGEHGMRQIKLYEQMRTPEGEAKARAAMQADVQAAMWAGLPVNTQIDMFEDLAPLDERAFADGEEAGLRGDFLENPYDVNSHHGQQYEAGWRSGQAKLGEGITKKEAELIKGQDEGGQGDPFPMEEDEAA
jgi:hypothetical protein